MRPLLLLGGVLLALSGSARAQDSVAADARYRGTAAGVSRFITHEMEDKDLPAVWIALVDDQRIVWARGFGIANPDSTPATAETVFRAGSISKLFTAMAVMRQVEAGRMDLDSPVSRYLPDFHPASNWPTPITLRQLLTHRSGLVREPPTGSYFDSAATTLSQTVESLNRTSLVFRPESTTKYSNAGVAVAGDAVARVSGKSFEETVLEQVLRPLGMTCSSFQPPAGQRMATGAMWTVDGRSFEAPPFLLGMSPAANLYTTVNDLGLFMQALFAGGRGRGSSVLGAESLEQMWQPQFGARGGYGLGFFLSDFDGTPHAGHGGAIYGFATELHILPREKLGVVVATNVDLANSVVERIAAFALRSMRAERSALILPEPVLTQPIAPESVRQMRGHFFRENRRFELRERQGRLLLLPAGGLPLALRSSGGDFVVDDIREFGNSFKPISADTVVFGDQLFARRPPPVPAALPDRWRGLIGEYGWDHNTLYLYEDLGRLRVLIEWFFAYPLEEISDSVFLFPSRGLYAGERLVVHRDREGKASAVELNGIRFPRRPVGPVEGGQLKIKPRRPVPDLIREALAATPPAQPAALKAPDLVDLATLDSTIKFDIRYATTNNFVGTIFYTQPRAFLQRPAAAGLLRAHQWLRERGYGLLIHDAYRPWYVTRIFWDATPDSLRWLVANPANGSRHNRGAAVDLTLYDLRTGRPIDMVGTYDEATARSLPDYPGGTSLQRWHRELLRTAMETNGFTIYPEEWWHFDYDGWREYPILNLTFEQVTSDK
jgi:CubicO group peptidase (beta-lactamase class C family)/D-alanyl-D-alanine dipeptidase